MSHDPQPGDRFREVGTKIHRFVETVIREDKDGWIVVTAEGQRWRLTTPDMVHGDAFRFVGTPLPDVHPPSPQLMP